MATNIIIDGNCVLDESFGLQTGGVAQGSEDNNDQDVSLASLMGSSAAFYERLFDGLGLDAGFATANGVAVRGSNFITVSSPNTSIIGLGFVDGDGNALATWQPGDPGVLTDLETLDGEAIYLSTDAEMGDQMVLGRTADGTIVFAIHLSPSGDLSSAGVEMVQFQPLHNPNADDPDDPVNLLDAIGVSARVSQEFNFNSLPSGQNLFGIVGDADNALVVIGMAPDLSGDGTFTNASNTINTSKGGGPTTIGINNQMFDPGDGAYFTFVTQPDPNYLAGVVGGLDQNEADDADNIKFGERIEADGGFVKIAQIQGNALASLSIKAFNGDNDLDGRAFASTGAGGGLGTGSVVTITQIVVKNGAGVIVQTIDAPTANADGSYTVTGLNAGYKIEWSTNGVHDQVLIQGVAGKFDIGGFGVDRPDGANVDIGDRLIFEDAGPDVTLSLVANAEVRVDESLDENPGEDESASLGKVTVAAAALFGGNADFGTDGHAADSSDWSLDLSDEAADSGLVDTASGEAVLLYSDGADIVGRISGGIEVLRISIDSDTGAVTLELSRALVHGDTGDPDEADTALSIASGLIFAVRTITDADDDQDSASADIGPAMKIEDDGPSVTLSLRAGAEVRVDESIGANDFEDETTSLGKVTVSGAVLFATDEAYGSDGGGADASAYSLALSAPGADSGLVDTATNLSVYLYVDGDDIVGRIAGGIEVFRISIDEDTGDVTLDQSRAMVHGDPDDPDEADTYLSIAASKVSAVRTVTDGDGDQDSASADIGPALRFEDDGPAIGPIDDGLVDFEAGDSVTKTLNGAVGSDVKTNPYTLTDYTESLTINGVDLEGVLAGDSRSVTYWADTGGDDIFGNAGDTAYYRMTLDQAAAGTYTFDVLIDPPPSVTEFNFDDLPSGQNLFGTVGTASSALIVIGRAPVLSGDGTFTNASDTINTSKGGGPVTIGIDNQMFDPGDGAVFTYVTNPVANYLAGAPGGLDQNEADDADNMQYGSTTEVDSAFCKIAQIQGNALASMRIEAFNVAGAPQGQNLALNHLGVDPAVSITAVRVYSANGTLLEDSSLPGQQNAAIVITITGGVADISGLNAGYKIEWDTNGDHDQVRITGLAGKFDIGGFGLNQGQDTPDQLLEFTATVTDGDGDSAFESWSVGIDGTGVNDDDSVSGVDAMALPLFREMYDPGFDLFASAYSIHPDSLLL
ncbi:DUF5801 repeats-in-toxin domain-containing protein [Sphingomonas sp. LY29]|uniref:DUF5801 repeats-in-toxin domain-containing protein n=1 Tax=Sphingomonas sp. LY29 TaxID=3095341 RepID=UPI002D76B8AA|nr:DUF5801 repeats-in-toxin domain-containing protein [Sphingomonas sp. LY29]WRP25841.1 DUF5801 repeats-in-toxin domain-containing protein [Sphingomonas sp. LY29]